MRDTAAEAAMEAMQGSSPPGFHFNLMSNTLTCRLKSQKVDFRVTKTPNLNGNHRDVNGNHRDVNGHHRDRRQAEPPASSQPKSILSTHESTEDGASGPRADKCNPPSRGNNSKPPSRSSAGRRHRIDSALSDQPERGRASRETSGYSRRSNSAGTSGQNSMARMSAMTSDSDITGLRSAGSSSAFSFESRGVGRSIQVVKRDGVFRSVDKYAPGRHVMREASFTPAGGACDYQMYTLPFGDDKTEDSLPLRGGAQTAKRPNKVSWGKVVPHPDSESTHSGEDLKPTSPIKRPPVSEDTFAFRRPAYSPSKSRVSEVGVMWTLPPAEGSTANNSAVKEMPKTPEKPMWSWLVMHEGKQQSRGKTRGGNSRGFTATPIVRSSTSNRPRTMHHSRNLHPVSTALEREGTSVSKTKWHVPSSLSSALEVERSVLGRLALVKRSGSQLVYTDDTFSPSIALGGSNNQLNKQSDLEVKEAAGKRQAEEKQQHNGKSTIDEDTNFSDSRHENSLSSPNKSRSTNF